MKVISTLWLASLLAVGLVASMNIARAQDIAQVTIDIVDVSNDSGDVRQSVAVTVSDTLVDNGVYRIHASLSPLAFGGVYESLNISTTCSSGMCFGSTTTLNEIYWITLPRRSSDENWEAHLTDRSLSQGWRFNPGSRYFDRDYGRVFRYMYFGYLSGDPLTVPVDGKSYLEESPITVVNGITPTFQIELVTVRDSEGSLVAEYPEYAYSMTQRDKGICDQITDTCQPKVIFEFRAPPGSPIGWDTGLVARAGFSNGNGSFERRTVDYEWAQTSTVKAYLPSILGD